MCLLDHRSFNVIARKKLSSFQKALILVLVMNHISLAKNIQERGRRIRASSREVGCKAKKCPGAAATTHVAVASLRRKAQGAHRSAPETQRAL